MMGDLINESREECGNPWSWCATEACHQLVAPNGEIACRSRRLLLIALHARTKECGRGAVCATSRDTSTNLPSCISGITGSGCGNNPERGTIKVAALGFALRDRHGAIKGADLLNCRDRCPGSTPRFKECRHILIVGDWKKELAHSPKGVWRIGDRIAADRLNAPANLGAPLGRERRCDGGEDAELCGELQRTCRACSGKDPFDLCTNSFTREACCQVGIAFDCGGGSRLDRQVEARNKPNRAEHAQRIFDKSFGRITNRTQQAVGEVIGAAMWINDGSICDRIGAAARTGGEAKRDRVDGEISTSKVAFDAWKEGDLVGATPVATLAIGAEGGDLAHHSLPSRHADGPKSILVGGV
jgi:hypothetical protein